MPSTMFVNGAPCKALRIDGKTIAKDTNGKVHRMNKDFTWKVMRIVQPTIKQAFEAT